MKTFLYSSIDENFLNSCADGINSSAHKIDKKVIFSDSADIGGQVEVLSGFSTMPGLPMVWIDPGFSEVAEGNGGTTLVTFTVSLSVAMASAVSVTYAAESDIALAGTDVQATGGRLTFNPGETTKTFSVSVIGDTLYEPDEGFWVRLSNPTGAVLDQSENGGAHEAFCIITNDDVFAPTPTPEPTATPTAGNDSLLGTALADSIDALAGDDTIRGGLGDDTINGGSGTDTALYSGSIGQYRLGVTGKTLTVTGPDGCDTLTGIEGLAFDQGSLDVSSLTGEAPGNAIYRFYNGKTGTHFYTNTTAERDAVINNLADFQFEGSAFGSTGGTGHSVWRFFNTQTGTHFYTISDAERDAITKNLPQFQFEGEAYKASVESAAGLDPLYRFFNTQTGTHFFTANQSERDAVLNTLPQFTYEGIGYYVDLL